MNKILFLSIFLGTCGCVTPKNWQPEQHQEMMLMCRTMCKDTVVQSYEPFTGDCSCHTKKD